MKPPFRIEIRPKPRRSKAVRKQWAWHVISRRRVFGAFKIEGWMGEHHFNRAHVIKMVERLFDAKRRGIEVTVLDSVA